jgi:outer membrane PBP1 activator LpoA protein
MFADTPWIVAPQPWVADLPAMYAEYWPSERRLGRLHAMGYDAFLLLGELYAARSGESVAVSGTTGHLTLDETGRVHRELPWAEFRRGEPVALPPHGLSNETPDYGDTPEDGQTDQTDAWAFPNQER